MKSKFFSAMGFVLVLFLINLTPTKTFSDESWTHQFRYPFDSTYSHSAVWPLQRSYSGHKGVDYAAVYETPVYAVMDGYVEETPTTNIPLNTQNPPISPDANNCVGFGNTIVIRNDEIGCSVRYGHLAPGTITLGLNDSVEAGDLIGLVGNTGKSTSTRIGVKLCGKGLGYHLHLEVRCDLENSTCPDTPNSETVFNPYNGLDYCDDTTAELELDPETSVPTSQTDQDNSLFIITGNDTFIFPSHDDDGSSDFDYEDNAYRCASTIYGGEETDWDYYCTPKEGNEYNLGETFRALYKIEDILEDHYFKAEFKNESGIVVQEDVTDTNEVSGYWEHAYFWPTARFYFPGLYYLQAYVVIQPTSGPEEEYELGGPISFIMNHPFCPFWEACFASSGGECSESCPCYW